MNYTLTRAKRKTISLRVERDLTVSVRAPMRMPSAEIERFVITHRDWIQKQLDRMTPEAENRAAFQYADGQAIPFHGGELPLASGTEKRAYREGGRLLLPEGCDRAQTVAAFLREDARVTVSARIAAYAPGMGAQPAGVSITSARTRWGSCSGKNRLCFSWRVACLPDDLIDYIVVHELAHIREHNHSSRFWAIVNGVLPDSAERRAALRAFQSRIIL